MTTVRLDQPIPESDFVAAEWETALDELRSLDQYGPNWDGEGAKAVRIDLIQTAERWLLSCRAAGDDVPGTIYPTPGGTVMLEWASANGTVYSAHVRIPGSVEMVVHIKGREPRFIVLPIPADDFLSLNRLDD